MERNVYLLRVAKVFGLFPFEIINNDIKTSTKLKILNIGIILALIASAILICRDYYIIGERPLSEIGTIVETCFGFYSAAGATLMLIKTSAISKNFHQIVKLTEETSVFLKEDKKFKRNYIAIASFTFECCSEIYFILFRSFSENPYRPWSFSVDIPYMIVRYYDILLTIVVMLFISGLNNLIKMINKKLKRLKESFFKRDLIIDLRILHEDAADLLKENHNCFQLFNLLNISTSAACLIYTMFHFLKDENFKFWEEAYWFSYWGGKVVALVLVCAETMYEVTMIL